MKTSMSKQIFTLMNYSSLIISSLCFFVILVQSPQLMAQQTPLSLYNFDALDLSESTGNYGAGTAKAIDMYDCGVGPMSNALLFEGGTDTICLDPQVKELFDDDFSFSFYFWPRTGIDSYTLFSIQNNCERDSSLNIRYTSQGEIRLEYSWHQVVFTRSGTSYSFYVDGAFIESITFLDDIAMGKNHPVYVGYSDCVGRFDEHYFGRIDEIAIYATAIDENTIKQLDLRPDRVISQDTTLFQGDSYKIVTGSSCATRISWTPTSGLDDPQSISPLATPSETTTYTVEFDNGTCTSTDTR